MIDDTGRVVKTVNYDAFGGIESQSGAGELGRYAWTVRELDVETGLQYNGARYYDPAIGRWISQDPLGFEAGDSNLYRYVNNRPTVATDPSGFAAQFLTPVAALKYKSKIVFADEMLHYEYAGENAKAINRVRKLIANIRNNPNSTKKELEQAQTLLFLNQAARQSMYNLIGLRNDPAVRFHIKYMVTSGIKSDLAFAQHVAAAKQPGYHLYVGHGSGTFKGGVDRANLKAISAALKKLKGSTKLFFSCCFPEPINKAVPQQLRMDIIGLKGITFPVKNPAIFAALFRPLNQIKQAAAKAKLNGKQIDVYLYIGQFMKRPDKGPLMTFSKEKRFENWK